MGPKEDHSKKVDLGEHSGHKTSETNTNGRELTRTNLLGLRSVPALLDGFERVFGL